VVPPADVWGYPRFPRSLFARPERDSRFDTGTPTRRPRQRPYRLARAAGEAADRRSAGEGPRARNAVLVLEALSPSHTVAPAQATADMLGGLLALEPISRFTSSVRDGRYLDAIRQLAIEEDVREAPNDGPPERRSPSQIGIRQAIPLCGPQSHRCNARTSRQVRQRETRTILPPPRTLRGRKAQRPSVSFRTQALERSDLTCSQGIAFTVPASSSLTRRSSSVAHAGRPLRIPRAFHAIEDLRRERKPVVGRQL